MTRSFQPVLNTFTVRANGLDFACLAWGEGPLVLLIHGFPDTACTWDAVGPALAAAGFRAVAPFTRGIAPTPVPADGDYGADTMAADMAALIEALGATSAIVVGHDFGASTAYALAGLFPNRVSKLVALAIPHPATLTFTVGTAWRARHFLTHRLPGAAQRFAAHDFAAMRVLYERWSPDFAWPDAELEAAKNSYSAPGCTAAALAYYAAIGTQPPAGHRAKIAAPTLILGGQSDGVLGAAAFEGSSRRFTGPCTVSMLPGGHFLHREHPGAVIAALLDFLI